MDQIPLLTIAEVRRLEHGVRARIRARAHDVAPRRKDPNAPVPSYFFRLSDATGVIAAKLWDTEAAVFHRLVNGPLTNGMEIETIVESNPVREPNVKVFWNMQYSSLLPKGAVSHPTYELDPEPLIAELELRIAGLRADLRNLCVAALSPRLIREFCELHAAVGHHHAKRYGLLVHWHEMDRYVAAYAPVLRDCDHDLALAGSLLHDYGKLFTYEVNGGLGVRPEESLVGHAALGAFELAKVAAALRCERRGPSLLLEEEILHCVFAHYGVHQPQQRRIHEDARDLLAHFAFLLYDELRPIHIEHPLAVETGDPTLDALVTHMRDALVHTDDVRLWSATATLLHHLHAIPVLHDPPLARALAHMLPMRFAATSRLLAPEEELVMRLGHAIAQLPPQLPSPSHTQQLMLVGTLLASRTPRAKKEYEPHLPRTIEARLIAEADASSAHHAKFIELRTATPDDPLGEIDRNTVLLGPPLTAKQFA